MNYFFYNLFRKTSSINLLLGGSLFVLGGSCYSLYNNICNLLNNNNLNNKNNELNKLLIKNDNLDNNLNNLNNINNNKKIDYNSKMDEYRLFRNND